MTLQDAFEKFMFAKRIQGLSSKSLKNYRDFLTPFVLVTGKSLLVQSLTLAHVEGYISGLLERSISRSTFATYVRNIKVFVRWLAENQDVPIKTAAIKVPRSPKKTLRVYTDAEIHAIFETATGSVPWLVLRNRAMIALMLDCGLRQNEICTLQKKDVRAKEHYLKVLGKGDKERYVPIGAHALAYLNRYWAACPHVGGHAFLNLSGGLVTCNAVKQVMYDLSRQLPFAFSSHRLRHNFATNYCLDQYRLHGQIDIYKLMILLGHEEVNTTRRYLHIANQILATQTNISHLDQLFDGTGNIGSTGR